ncbi:transporter substrate-binding domain-containing protein [Paucibacter sp. PLA-PC-4]|uniref:substrate-binding periplasmic protein n=1 Tax=Paucibacter sp. PLA-PC-4 TaxID=2993655 RepID=UPI0022489DA2|nr:transporter substrate-binding domain-containing protein [Paucibacter sp. PLA-PC-4]MCX2860294.1 transporter substrate-binding domain-containing protein [Paucibacter sp. PLA-PC-4]
MPIAPMLSPTLLWASLLMLLPAPTSAEPGWRVYTHSLGEQAERLQGELRGKPGAGKRGYYVELMRALLTQLGLPTRIEEVPLARGMLLVQTEDRVAFFNLNRKPEREEQVHWIGPISQERFVFHENSRRPSGIRTLAQGRELSVCVVHGSAHERLLDVQGFKQLTRHNAYTGCLRMLALGRVRLAVAPENGLREAGMADGDLQATPVTVHTALGFVALSRSTPQAEVERWQGAWQELVRSGRVQLLLERYAQPLPGSEPAS